MLYVSKKYNLICAHNVYIHTCNKADDNSDTANSLSFPPQYLNNNHVTYYVIT